MQGINTRTSTSNATALSVNAEASKMLEAALEQMDGIISGSSGGGVAASPTDGVTAADPKGDRPQAPSSSSGVSSSSSPSPMVMHERSVISAANVLSTAKTLALALEQVGPSAPTPDFSTAAIIGNWLDGCLPRRDADERLRSVQHEKDVLARQYQQLSERVSGQTERIGELEKLLTQKIQELSYKDDKLQRQTMLCSSLDTKNLELLTALSELKLQKAALELENADLRSIETRLENISLAVAAESQQGGGHGQAQGQAAANNSLSGRRLPFGSVGNLNQVGANASFDGGRAPKTPPALLRHQIHPQFHSLPRSHATKHGNNNNNNNNNFNTNNKNSQANNNNNNNQRSSDESGGSGGGGGGGGGSSGSGLKAQRNVAFASNEKIIDDSRSGGAGDFPTSMNGSFMSQQNSTPSPTLKERSAKGFLQIFGKLRRSNSGNLELPSLEQAEPEFRRGGIGRATAAGRIEWSPSPSLPMKKAYSDWTPQEVCNWLNDLGLAIYEEDCRKWLRANPHICFFTASPVDIEKELNIKFALHRKKIYLACDELTGREHDELALKAAELNTSWVMRWLDDIGLPQYKDTFQKAKVDGRILHRLTMEDLSLLNVTSCLHVASLRSGIQCMREMSWNPDCLIRRSCSGSERAAVKNYQDDASPEGGSRDDSVASACEPTENIALWTAHRVMEWLRVVDLSEYAPNLRGAGVHGALMRYENRFNAALLADLLSIPQQKTLLRRHLATHFKELVGSHVIQMKRDAENQFGYQPLTIASKVKAPKKTQFSLKRRRSTKGSADSDWTDYVCPMSMSMCLGQVFPSSPAMSAASTTAAAASSTTTSMSASSSPTPSSPAVQPSNGGGALSLSMVSESGESKTASESPKQQQQQQQTTPESTSPKPAVNFQYTPKKRVMRRIMNLSLPPPPPKPSNDHSCRFLHVFVGRGGTLKPFALPTTHPVNHSLALDTHTHTPSHTSNHSFTIATTSATAKSPSY